MKRFISKSQLILLFSYVIFIAHTLAEPPEAVKNEFIAHRQRQREPRLSARTGRNLQSRTLTAVEDSRNWAGAVQFSPSSGTFNSVSAQWTLPTVSLPANATGSGMWWLSVEVAIDDSQSNNCSGIVAAGTDSYVQVSTTGAVTTGGVVWYQWYPGNKTDFPFSSFSPGDTAQVSITAITSSEVQVQVMTSGSSSGSYEESISAPGDSIQVCGMDVEWGVEDAFINSMSNNLVPFAEFTTVTMQNCTATTTTGATVNLTGATLADMVQSGKVLATADGVSDTELQVNYG